MDKNYLKIAVSYLNKYKIKSKSWQEIMKNNKIPLDIKYYINGCRFLYMDMMIKKINKLSCDCLNIYPTGSLRLTSDKDIQISINIDKCNSVKLLKDLISKIFDVIKRANKDWNSKDFEYLLDIHFYPPTLLNFMELKHKSKGTKYIRVATKSRGHKKNIIFIPQIQTPELVKDFQKKELTKLKTKIKEDTTLYYTKYIDDIAFCLYTIIECYKGNIKLSNQEFNDYLHCLTKYNNIGPEMYRTISSIIVIVWHLQMRNKLSKKMLQVLTPIACKENKMLYKESKKQKYKLRYEYCQKFM